MHWLASWVSSLSKTHFHGLPTTYQVPPGQFSLDSMALNFWLDMRAVGCLIPQWARARPCPCRQRVGSTYIQREGRPNREKSSKVTDVWQPAAAPGEKARARFEEGWAAVGSQPADSRLAVCVQLVGRLLVVGSPPAGSGLAVGW